jgi:hypothetical protein
MPRRRIKRLELPRNPLLADIPALDAWIAVQVSAGVSPAEMFSKVLPSAAQLQELEAERTRVDNEAATAKRLARNAALEDPAKRAHALRRFQRRLRKWDRQREAKNISKIIPTLS